MEYPNHSTFLSRGLRPSFLMLQLNPPIPVVTPKGKGWAHVLIDYSQEHDLLWVVFLDESGECWTLPNRDVRIQKNMSLGRN